MILDSQCNRVYLSTLLRQTCPQTYSNLTKILDRRGVKWSFLPDTKDFWCRDFMPLQVDKGRFAAYKYNPDYLRSFKKYRGKITDATDVMAGLDLECDNLISDIVLDGGNVVRCGTKVVMTAKVFEENPSIRPYDLLERLEAAFDADIIILPWDTKEVFGHADGVCRYVDDDTILMTNYRQIEKKMGQRFYECLKPHFKNIRELHFSSGKQSKYNWAHINWLQTDKVLIIPAFGDESDWEAREMIEWLMPSYEGRIEFCECLDLVKLGGALNCCSWTIME